MAAQIQIKERIEALSDWRDTLQNELTSIKARIGELMADITHRILVKEESAASAAVEQAWAEIHSLNLPRRDMCKKQMADCIAEWASLQADSGDSST